MHYMLNGSQEHCVTVFLGSSLGTKPVYEEVARSVGASLARHRVTLCYGGGQTGCMGALCRAALEAGGRVHGIIPRAFLSVEKPLESLPAVPYEQASPEDRHVESQVASMHERKRKMADLSRGFIGLPGGYGTLEEVGTRILDRRNGNMVRRGHSKALFRSGKLTSTADRTQLGIHRKPVVLLNVDGFFAPLKAFVDNAIDQGFISPHNRQFMTFVDCPAGTDPAEFDWGQAALQVMESWHAEGAGGGKAYDFDWRDHHDQRRVTSDLA